MTPILISAEEYLNTSYLDGDREFIDGQVIIRNLGEPDHSALQKILILQLSRLKKTFGIAVRPECRTRVSKARYRVPDVLVMKLPFRQNKRVILDTPIIIIEIVSPDDRMRDTMQRFRDYESLGVRHIIQMDPEDRTTFLYSHGDLVRRDLTTLELPDGALLPFDTGSLLAQLDEQ